MRLWWVVPEDLAVINVGQAVDATIRMAQVAVMRRKAWLLSQAAGRLAVTGGRPLPTGTVPNITGVMTAAVTRGRLDVYA